MEDKITPFVLLAKGARGRGLCDLICKATSEPLLFNFGELMDVPTISEMQQGDLAPHFRLLQLFAYGTWSQYSDEATNLPKLNDQQKLKLKQLTLVSLAVACKTLSYESIMQQLDLATVRELEDFIISECFYTGLAKGKLDQKMRVLQVHDVISRDVKFEELPGLGNDLESWLASCEGVMQSIEQRIQFSVTAAEEASKRKAAVETKIEDAKLAVKADMERGGIGSGLWTLDDDGAPDYMEEDRIGHLGGMAGGSGGDGMDFRGGGGERSEHRMQGRPKSRRR